MDVLSAVLRELRLRSASYRVLRLRAPWRIRFDGGLRGVHLVRTGECDLTLDGAPPVRLRAGDLVIWRHEIPHGASANRSDQPRLAHYVNHYPMHWPDERPWL